MPEQFMRMTDGDVIVVLGMDEGEMVVVALLNKSGDLVLDHPGVSEPARKEAKKWWYSCKWSQDGNQAADSICSGQACEIREGGADDDARKRHTGIRSGEVVDQRHGDRRT